MLGLPVDIVEHVEAFSSVVFLLGQLDHIAKDEREIDESLGFGRFKDARLVLGTVEFTKDKSLLYRVLDLLSINIVEGTVTVGEKVISGKPFE